MPRPRKSRCVGGLPSITYFKPAGVPLRTLDEVVITVDEYEALKLKDLEGKTQEEAAKQMDISQPTLCRILESARKKLTDAIVNGKAIRVHGGTYTIRRMGRRWRMHI